MQQRYFSLSQEPMRSLVVYSGADVALAGEERHMRKRCDARGLARTRGQLRRGSPVFSMRASSELCDGTTISKAGRQAGIINIVVAFSAAGEFISPFDPCSYTVGEGAKAVIDWLADSECTYQIHRDGLQ